MNRFLLCENPMQGGHIFILHTLRPKCLIEVYEPQTDPGSFGNTHHVFHYLNSKKTIETYALVIRDVYDDSAPDNLNKALYEAWSWYKSYLTFEDKTLDDLNKEDSLSNLN